MSTPVRFSDKQYQNWFKSNESYHIMKEALHDHIDNEVKKLHRHITQKVSRNQRASSTGNQCGSCSSKDIILTGGNWSINCKNNICNIWLQQILAVHEEPRNSCINWKNANIRLWPTDCYEVIKVFMPKGQQNTKKMPNDLDAPAILSFFKYCKWFRKDSIKKAILSELIDFGNKVRHSGFRKMSDRDKDRSIDLMIKLLIDLKIRGDAISELKMLKKEDIDIRFRGTEIRLLQDMVSGLVNDINTVKEDMATMENSVSENMEEVRNTTETIGKVVAVNTDMEGIRKSLEEHRDIYDKMVLFFGQNPDIHDKAITDKLQTIDRDHKDLHSKFTRLETEGQKINSRLLLLGKKVEGMDERPAAVEEQKKHETETRKERPETEGLRELKNQTENILRTHRKLKYILTEQAENAEKLLAEKRSIVIEGNPGEGKTTLSRHLIDNEKFRDKRVVLDSPRQWEKVDTGSIAIVVLEDVFGKYDFDPGHLQEWMVHLPTIQEHVAVGELHVIVTTRVDVLSKAYCQRLGSLKLFSKELSLTLSSKQLTNSEKMSILKRELDKHQRNMKEDEIKLCIANFGGLIGFPQCCSLFAGDIKSFDKGPDFFRSPKEFFVENIEGLEPTRLLSLAFLFCNGKILEENLSSETMPESSKKLLMELASRVFFIENQTAITLLRDAYDNFGEVYVVKSISYDFSLKPVVEKHSIMFTHAAVSAAVGHVLYNRCCEMVVKYGDSQYLYQRTYTAKVKGSTSENVFLPVSVYGLLAERMVHDVVNRRLVSSVVKHSALKRPDFIKKLKAELNKGNLLKDFFMAGKDVFYMAGKNKFQSDTLSEGKCVTFMQYILQGDEDVVRLVFDELLEILACAHNDNIPDCWQCEEKQDLLELALYYHHFEIADKLIARKACYTCVSLCNAARHGDLKRVQTITERLKENQVFNPESEKAKYALCRAYVSGNQSLIEFLLNEGIILDCWCVVNAVKHGDINVLFKVVEHLKRYNQWNSKCDDASKALEVAIREQKDDVYNLFVKDGVSLKMKNLPGVMWVLEISLESLQKVIQHTKGTENWDPKCDDASKALEVAIYRRKYDVYDLLIQEGVSLKMEHFFHVTLVSEISLESLKTVIQHMKDADNWDPKCVYASNALQVAIHREKYDVYHLLVQEGVSIKMKNLPCIIILQASLESVEKAIHHLKQTENWDPKCDDASQALEVAIYREKYDVYDMLVEEGVSFKMKNLPGIIILQISLESFKKEIHHLKDTDNWDPKCDDASEALGAAIRRDEYDVFDLLVQDGVSLKMTNLLNIIMGVDEISLESVQKVMHHLKRTHNWDPKCDDASEALQFAIFVQKDDVYDLLVQEGVSLKTKTLTGIIIQQMSLKSVKRAIHHLKDTDNWDPKCDDASRVLENAIREQKYDVYDLLVQEGVSLKMKNLPGIIMKVGEISLEPVKKAIHHLKKTDNWDPKCDDASKALKVAIREQKDDVYDLLVQEGVSLKTKTLTGIIIRQMSLKSVKRAIHHLKDTDNWDPKCDDASRVLENAIREQKYDVYDLLVQEGVSLKMKNLPGIIMKVGEISLEPVKKAIHHLKKTDNWDPKCDDASKALKVAIREQKDDVYDLLVQEGVSLKMKNLPGIIMEVDEISLEPVKKAIHHLKKTDNWDPKCVYASEALEVAIHGEKYDVYVLLVQDGVSLKMKNLQSIIMGVDEISLESVMTAIHHLKETDNWDPKCDDASKALEAAIHRKKYDVYDLLVQEGVSLKMKNLPCIII